VIIPQKGRPRNFCVDISGRGGSTPVSPDPPLNTGLVRWLVHEELRPIRLLKTFYVRIPGLLLYIILLTCVIGLLTENGRRIKKDEQILILVYCAREHDRV